MNLRILAAFALCLAPACGSSDPAALTDQGSKALNSGDYEGAAKSYEKALAALGSDTANPEWMHAKLGLIKAHTQTDAPRAKTEFLELAAAAPSKITDKEYNLIGAKLGDANHLQEAKEVLLVGMKAYPESPHLQALLTELGKRAEASGDTELTKSLRSMGYVGK